MLFCSKSWWCWRSNCLIDKIWALSDSFVVVVQITAVFLNIPWKMYEMIFYKRLVSRNIPVIPIKWRHRPFFWKTFYVFRTFEGKIFLRSLFLLRSEILDCIPVTLKKKEQFWKYIFCNFWYFRTFLYVHFQKSIYSGVFSLIVGCSCNSAIALKGNTVTCAFPDIPKFLVRRC